MSRRVYLHIGAPKTGTTYLQDRLARNRASLARHGVDLPAPATADPTLFQFRAALDALGQDWGGEPGHAKGAWPALLKRVRRGGDTVIISHEIFAPAPAEKVERIMTALTEAAGDREVHVVYSARDLGRQLPAAWQESIKQGRKWTFRRFLNRVEHGNTWFIKAFDLPQVLGRWSVGLPPERVHVVTVPPGRALRANKDLLWLRMCEAFAIDPAWAPAESLKANASLGIAETQLLRQLNRRMERSVRREAAFDELIREKLAQDLLISRTSKPVRLPPDRFDWAEAQADDWIAWLTGSGVRVIGDVEELRPIRPPADEPYLDPDKVRTKEAFAAAVDALAAMTVEAARRPDPERGARAMVRVAAERLRAQKTAQKMAP